MLSCRRDLLRHFNSVHSSLTYVFHLADFVDISYLTYFERTSLVTFAELCILLCYEVLILKFRKRVSLLESFLSAILFVLAQFCRNCQPFLISPFCTQFHCFALNFTVLHSISLFCTGEIALFTNLGLIDMLSANQAAEIVACILLRRKQA